jgi:hypothetical protein
VILETINEAPRLGDNAFPGQCKPFGQTKCPTQTDKSTRGFYLETTL